MRARSTAILTVILLTACGEMSADRKAGTERPDPDQRYRATTTVLEAVGREPMLCLGAIATSLPPQCGDVPIANWDWASVPGEQRRSGVIWGEYSVVGTFDGTSFTVLQARRSQGAEGPTDDTFPIETPCKEPDGGWVAVDPSRATDADLQAARRWAEAQHDFAGVWIDHTRRSSESGHPGPYVLNVAFTGDLDGRWAMLRELWGGPLCLVRYGRTYQELRRIQNELANRAAADVGLQLLWSSTDVVHNQVEIGVVVADAAAQTALDRLYGIGAVRISPALEPVTGTGASAPKAHDSSPTPASSNAASGPPPEPPRAENTMFQACPALQGSLPVGKDAAAEAAEAALDYALNSNAGERLADPAAAINGVPAGFAPRRASASGTRWSKGEGLIEHACGKRVAARSWRVTIDDGTSSASLDTWLYLIQRADGWNVWGWF